MHLRGEVFLDVSGDGHADKNVTSGGEKDLDRLQSVVRPLERRTHKSLVKLFSGESMKVIIEAASSGVPHRFEGILVVM